MFDFLVNFYYFYFVTYNTGIFSGYTIAINELVSSCHFERM